MKKTLFTVMFIALFAIIGFQPAYAYDDIIPVTAYTMATGDAYIIDVRTDAEWTWIGHPGENKIGEGADLDGKVVNISWKKDVKGVLIVNPTFVSDVQEVFAPNTTLILMCRSGKRSVDASLALEAAGFTNVFNMLNGFQGQKTPEGYRDVPDSGWVNSGLPYTTSEVGAYDD